MKITKEIRQVSRTMLRASFTDGRLDQGKIRALIDSVINERPRNFVGILENYKRLLRLEVDKRHARIESATPLAPQEGAQIVENLKRKYGQDITTDFSVNPALLGGMRIRVGSDVCDSTFRDRLERLQQKL